SVSLAIFYSHMHFEVSQMVITLRELVTNCDRFARTTSREVVAICDHLFFPDAACRRRLAKLVHVSIPPMRLAYRDHRRQNLVPRLGLLHRLVGKHAAVP